MAFETHEAEQPHDQQLPPSAKDEDEEAAPEADDAAQEAEAPDELDEAPPDGVGAASDEEAEVPTEEDGADIAEEPEDDTESVAGETETEEEGLQMEMPGVDGLNEEDDGFQLDGLDVPAGKRGGVEDLDFDAAEAEEAYDVPVDEDMLPESPEAFDGEGVEYEDDVPAHHGGAHRVLIIGNLLFFAAVVAFILIMLWRKESERQVNEGAPPVPPGYVYFTAPKTPAREIEDVLASLAFDQGDAKGEPMFVREDYAAIVRTAEKPEACQVVIRLKPTYWDETMVKPDAENKAVHAVRALFSLIPGLKKVGVKMLFKFNTEPGRKPEAALTVVAERAQHEKAGYGKGEPGDVLKAFKTIYHPKLVAP